MLRTALHHARPRRSVRRPCACETFEPRRLLAAAPAGVALDTTFGGDGRVEVPMETASFIVDPSGKLVVTGIVTAPGVESGAVLRLNGDGSPDTTFNNGQVLTLAPPSDGNMYRPHGSLLMPDGGILVTGERIRRLPDTTLEYRPYLARYNADGTLDRAFGGGASNDGILVPASGTLAGNMGAPRLLPSGKIFAAGNVLDVPGQYDFGFWRFNADGTPDSTFAANGFRRQDVTPDDYVLSLAPLPDGSFFVQSQHGVLAFNADASLRGPVGSSTWYGEVAATPDGKVLVADVVSDGAVSNTVYTTTVRRFFADGSHDATFGDGGDGSTTLAVGANGDYPASLAVFPDGSVVVGTISADAGPSQHEPFVRLSPSGTPDPAFGILTVPATFAGAAMPGPGGLLYINGTAVEIGPTGQTVRKPVIFAERLDPGIVIDPGGPYGPVDEGGRFAVSDAGSSYEHGRIVKYEWDSSFNGFEFTPDAEGATATLTAGDGNPARGVALRVTTDDGLQAISPVPAEVRVRNLPPTITSLSDGSTLIPFGWSGPFRGSVVDPGGDTVSVRIDFGDGTAPVVVSPDSFGNFQAEHTFPRGTFTVRATATDDDGASSTREVTIVAADVVGKVFQDLEDNGQLQAFVDLPFPGVTVYVDTDGDGTLDDGEPRTLSNGAGDYAFPSLPENVYTIRIVPVPGMHLTTPGSLSPVVVTRQSGSVRNFGLSNKARVTGVVFNDANANGARDAGEAALRGGARNVYLDLDNDGVYDANEPKAIVSGDEYVIPDLSPGTYTVRYLPGLMAGGAADNEAAQTFPNERGGQTGHTVTVAAGEVSSGHDFGSFFGNTAVTGVVYVDRNRNGTREVGPTGEAVMTGRVVYLDFDNDGVLDPDESRSTTNDPRKGEGYFLPVVRGNTYTVRTVIPDGWTQSQPAGGAGAPYVLTVDPQNTAALQNRNFGTHAVAPAAVVGRHLFYFASVFSGMDRSDPAIDNGIAADKAALLPGQQSGFANVSSYNRGINGVMIDLNELAIPNRAAEFVHFALRDGTSQQPDAWVPVSPIAPVQVRRGAGVGGSDRIVAVFADNRIRNKWLRVTVDAGPGTGLAAPDVFYFGHLAGETGDALTPTRVSAADLAAVKRALNTVATISSRFDFNRDGLVNALDLGIARANLNRSLPSAFTPAATQPAGLGTGLSIASPDDGQGKVLRPAEALL